MLSIHVSLKISLILWWQSLSTNKDRENHLPLVMITKKSEYERQTPPKNPSGRISKEF